MSKALRILFVLPCYGGSLPIGQYCVQALRDLGHIVEVFDSPSFHEAYVSLQSLGVSAERNSFLVNTFTNLLSEAVYAKAEQFAPDFVFAMAQAPLSLGVLKRFERDKIPTAMWFVEDYTLFTYWRAYANLYSYFFVIQKEPFLSLLAEGGHTNAHYLPLAALPNFHKKMPLAEVEKVKYGADVAFLGAGYPNRRREFKKLLSYNFKIWGSDWEGDSILEPFVQDKGARVSPEASVKIYNATKINLNLHSSVKNEDNQMGDFVNPRTFELASMGAFQLVDKRALMPELFELEGENKELVTFSNFDEVHDLIAYYIKNPEEREAITKRAVEKVHTKHSYQARMQEVVDIISKNLAPRSEEENYFSDMPEDFQKELVTLIKQYNLPASANLTDVVNAIKQVRKPLEPLEASILFLDEWRKQYG